MEILRKQKEESKKNVLMIDVNMEEMATKVDKLEKELKEMNAKKS